jgi:molybdenum cofactor cytidylyltransferase
LEKRKETGMPIVACSYENSTGTPALFHKNYFQYLLQLKGDRGAKKLISDNPEKVAKILFPDGITDIDTTEDYNVLKNKNDC